MSDLVEAAKLLEAAEKQLPGWGFLLRNFRNGEGRYFCNITSPDFAATYTVHGRQGVSSSHTGQRFPCEAATAVEAVRGSLRQIDPLFFEVAPA